ncbi:MAG: Na+/H+ antiporter subunit E [Acidobacteriota bacterium]
MVLLPALGSAWLLWSGFFNVRMMSFGVISCVGTALLCWRMGIADEESQPLALLPGIVTYLPWLLWQIVISNLAVARVILTPSLPIAPQLLRVRASQKTTVGLVTHANSITLTPGTVTLDIGTGSALVHALTRDSARGVLDGAIDRRVSRLEGPADPMKLRGAQPAPHDEDSSA